MPIRKISTEELLAELLRRDPWLDRHQTAPLLDMAPSTLRGKDARQEHDLVYHKFGPKGVVKYKFSEVQAHIKRLEVRQQCPD